MYISITTGHVESTCEALGSWALIKIRHDAGQSETMLPTIRFAFGSIQFDANN